MSYNIYDWTIIGLHTAAFILLSIIFVSNRNQKLEDISKLIFFVILFFRLIKNMIILIRYILIINSNICRFITFFTTICDFNTFFYFIFAGFSIIVVTFNMNSSFKFIKFVKNNFSYIFLVEFLITLIVPSILYFNNKKYQVEQNICYEDDKHYKIIQIIYFTLFTIMTICFIITLIGIVTQHKENIIYENSNYKRRLTVIIIIVIFCLLCEINPVFVLLKVTSEYFNIYFYNILYALIECILAIVLALIFNTYQNIKNYFDDSSYLVIRNSLTSELEIHSESESN